MLKRSASSTQDSQSPPQKHNSLDTSAKRSKLSEAQAGDTYAGLVASNHKAPPGQQLHLGPPIKKLNPEETKEFWQAAAGLKER